MAERNRLMSQPITPLTAQATAPSYAAKDVTNDETERTAEEIRLDIAARRESISDTVDLLSDRVQRTFDWRTYLNEYPLVAVGVAAGAGLLVASLFKRRATPTERMVEALADAVEDITDRFRGQLDSVGVKRSSGLSRTVKAAATGALTKAATDYLRNRLTEQGVLRPNADDQTAVLAAQHATEQPAHKAAHF